MNFVSCLRVAAFTTAALACYSASAQTPMPESVPGSEPDPYPRRSPRTLSGAAAKTWLRLASPIALPFEKETPLADVLKFIRKATAGPKDSGLAIFVDPAALRKNKATMSSPVSISVEGVALSTSLNLLLKQLNLAYGVQDDGVIFAGNKGEIPFSQGRPVTKAQAEVWVRLDRRVDVPFEKAASLDECVKFLKASTLEKGNDVGVSVFVDPISLMEHDIKADARMTLGARGLPLSGALSLLLNQLDLCFHVRRDGVVVITHKDGNRNDDTERDETPDLRAVVEGHSAEIAKLRREVQALRAGAGPKAGATTPATPGSPTGTGAGFR